MRILYFLMLFLVLSAQAKHILVIESYHADYAWDQGYKKALKEHLPDHQFSFFQMDTKRIAKREFDRKAFQVWQMYLDLKPDLVVLADDNAMTYLAERFMATDTPMVFLGVNKNPRDYGIEDAKNFTGVLERPLMKRSVLSLHGLVPSLNRVLVLFDSGVTSYASLGIEFNHQNVMKVSDIRVDIKLLEKWELWQQEVLEAKQQNYDAIVVGLYHTLKDENLRHIHEDDVLRWTSANTPVPLFSLWDFSVGKGLTIGGLVLESYEQGKEAAAIINEIFNGVAPNTINPKTAVKGRYIYSRYELERFKLTLPEPIAQVARWVE